MLNFNFYVTLIVLCINFFISYKVWQSDHKQFTNKIFSFLVAELNLWMLFNNLAMSAVDNSATALLFVRLTMVITAAIPVTLYFLSLTFPNKKFTLSRPKVTLCLIWAILNMLINLTPFVFTAAQVVNGNMVLTPSWGVATVALNMLIFMGAAAWNFFKKFRQAKGTEKIRFGYLVFSFVLAVSSAFIFNFLLVVAFQIGYLTSLGSWLMSSIITAIVGYSLLKIRFSGIDFVLAKIVYYAFLVVWVLIAAVFLLNVRGWAQQFTYPIAMTFITSWVIGFVYIYNHFQDYLIKRIVNHGLDWKAENKKFLTQIHQEMNLETIIIDTLRFISLLIKNDGNLIFADFSDDEKFFFTSTFDEEKQEPEKIYQTCLDIWQKQPVPRPLVLEEINASHDPTYKKIIHLMKQENFWVIFPIKLYDGITGMLVTGDKKNKDPYFVQDIILIEQTLNETALAIDKALVLQSAKDLNQFLQHKINAATKKLVKVNEKLIVADKMKDEFVSVASHELRTPMTAIKNYLWLVSKNNNAQHFQENKKFINIALNSTDRLIAMVNDMLTISRIEGNRFELNKQKIDLNELADRVYNDLLPMAENKKLSFLKKHSKKPLLIYADHGKILEVMNNLVGNALKFTAAGRVELNCYEFEDRAIFTVTDTGTGIDAADFPKLFKKFCRLENSYVKIKETGTGLGLYISKEIMDKHHGDISVTSQLGKGSTFTLSFPLKES